MPGAYLHIYAEQPINPQATTGRKTLRLLLFPSKTEVAHCEKCRTSMGYFFSIVFLNSMPSRTRSCTLNDDISLANAIRFRFIQNLSHKFLGNVDKRPFLLNFDLADNMSGDIGMT